jgi:hypothetical protein
MRLASLAPQVVGAEAGADGNLGAFLNCQCCCLAGVHLSSCCGCLFWDIALCSGTSEWFATYISRGLSLSSSLSSSIALSTVDGAPGLLQRASSLGQTTWLPSGSVFDRRINGRKQVNCRRERTTATESVVASRPQAMAEEQGSAYTEKLSFESEFARGIAHRKTKVKVRQPRLHSLCSFIPLSNYSFDPYAP